MPKSGNEPAHYFSPCRQCRVHRSKRVVRTKRLGLALEFMAELDRCISLASKNPFRFTVVCEDIRRVVANRFPYGIYFRTEDHRIVVLAVFHGSRDPAFGSPEPCAQAGLRKSAQSLSSTFGPIKHGMYLD